MARKKKITVPSNFSIIVQNGGVEEIAPDQYMLSGVSISFDMPDGSTIIRNPGKCHIGTGNEFWEASTGTGMARLEAALLLLAKRYGDEAEAKVTKVTNTLYVIDSATPDILITG